jgi:hypothetical protein
MNWVKCTLRLYANHNQAEISSGVGYANHNQAEISSGVGYANHNQAEICSGVGKILQISDND